MTRTVLSIASVLALLGIASYSRATATDSGAGADAAAAEIIALERGALDRWGKGDPQGFFDIMAAEETYFDPLTGKRVDGLAALQKYMAPFAGKISIERFEMIDPKVQRQGDLAVLTFNLVDYGASLGGSPKTTARWNSTEVFRKIDGGWKIVHSHWSFTKPELKP
jgi:ketosteroid isomerase-like protein